MRRYVIAAVLVTAFATPALAEQFYVAFDGKRCEMFSHKPPSGMNILGTYNSRQNAKKAMEKMDQCKSGQLGTSQGRRLRSAPLFQLIDPQ